MKLLRISLLTCAIILSFSSCTNQKAESTLLTDKQSCSLEDCPSPPTKIEGSLSIESDQGAYQLNMDKSDMIEIAGKCSDLGVRANRILVQVYEGEDTSLPPYVDNESSVNCVNSTTPSINGQRCFWLTQGRGVIDSGLEYPQCFNGRFSFSVKVGRLLRTVDSGPGAVLDEVNNPRRKYMVRFKIRTTDGAISESAWNSTLIERGVSKPTFSQNSLPFTDYKCDVQINASKNLNNLGDVKYDIYLKPDFVLTDSETETLITRSNIFPFGSVPIPYVDPIPANPIVHATNYRLYNIIPGVKYQIRVKAKDTKYTYALLPTPGVTPEEGPFSDGLQCGTAVGADGRPVLNLDGPASIDLDMSLPANGSSCGVSKKKCKFVAQLPVTGNPPPNSTAGVTNSGEYEWMVVKGMTSWASDYDPLVASQPCFPGGVAGASPNASPGPPSLTEGCKTPTGSDWRSVVTGSNEFEFRPESYPKNTCASASSNTYKGNYGVAVRYVDGATGFKGEWSNVVVCPLTK